VIPPIYAAAVKNLQQHGIRMSVLQQAASLDLNVRTVTSIRKSHMAFQKHYLVQLQTEDRRMVRELPAGTVIVQTSQPLGRLAGWLLEPESCDGLTTWNYFDDVLREGAEYPVFTLPSPVNLTTVPVHVAP